MALWEVRQQMKPFGEVPTADQFKALRAGLAHHLSTKMDGSMSSDPQAGLKRVVEFFTVYGVILTPEDVSGYHLRGGANRTAFTLHLRPLNAMRILISHQVQTQEKCFNIKNQPAHLNTRK